MNVGAPFLIETKGGHIRPRREQKGGQTWLRRKHGERGRRADKDGRDGDKRAAKDGRDGDTRGK